METSESLGKRCLRKGGKGGCSPKQPKQHATPTCNNSGTRAVTRKSPPRGTSGASTSAGPTGTTSSRGPGHPHQHLMGGPAHQHRPPRPRSPEREVRRSHRRRPPVNYKENDDLNDSDSNDNDLNDNDFNDSDSNDNDLNDSDSNDNDLNDSDSNDDDILAELAELRAKQERRRAQQKASRARRKARKAKGSETPLVSVEDDVYQQVAKLRAKEARRRAQRRAESNRYRARHRDRIAAYQKQYYALNVERLRAYKREYYRSKAGRQWQQQYNARKREAAALTRAMVRKRTEEKRQALGPLKLTVTVEDFMSDFCHTLSPSPEDAMDQSSTLMDMDSGVVHPLDHSVGDESSCDMWDDGKGFLDNLLDDLSSDESLFDFVNDMMEEDPSFDLDDFVS